MHPSARAFAFAVFGLMPLGGCALVAPEAAGRFDATAAAERTRKPGEAWVRLPDAAGGIKTVLETSVDGFARQRVILAGAESLPGENALSVMIGRTGPPDPAAIDREIAEALPGTPMRIAAMEDTNAVGPFRYAVGEAGPFTCVYAWQNVDDAALRIRLCRTAPAEETLALIRDLSFERPAPPAG